MSRKGFRTLGWIAALLVTASGCVERRMFIETVGPDGRPLTAKIYVNDQELGNTPVGQEFLYYGKYNIRVEHPAYKTLTVQEDLKAPWFAYPPFDFFVENLYPGTIRDIRRITYPLQLIEPTNVDDLRREAEEARQSGRAIPDPDPRTIVPKSGPNPNGKRKNVAPPIGVAPQPEQPPFPPGM